MGIVRKGKVVTREHTLVLLAMKDGSFFIFILIKEESLCKQ